MHPAAAEPAAEATGFLIKLISLGQKEDKMNIVLEALNFRHACKKFDPEKKINKNDLD